MIVTVQDIIEAQLRLIGVLDPVEPADAMMITNAIQANNIMLDSWSAKRLMVRALVQEGFPLVAGKASYTIGVGGNFNTSKPMTVTGAFLRDGQSVDTGMSIYSEDQYKARDDKSITQGRPDALWYDPGLTQQAVQTGTIWVYVIPDGTTPYTLFVTQQKMLTEFVNPTDTLTMEPQYFRALKFCGAIEQYYEYRKHTQPIPMEIKKAARESMSTIMTLNSVQGLVPLDVPGSKRSVFNIYVGDEVQ
jgi:hypothetical protein